MFVLSIIWNCWSSLFKFLFMSWFQVLFSFTKFLILSDKIKIFLSIYSAPSVYRPPFYRQPRLSPKFSYVPISPIKNTSLYCQTQLPPSATGFQTLNSPVSTAHNYLLTAVYWPVIMECQNWSSDTVIDLIVEGRNRWPVVLITG